MPPFTIMRTITSAWAGYLRHIEHIDPHPMGYHNYREALGIDNTFIPLSVDDKGPRPKEGFWKKKGYLTTCTAARSNKIEIPYFISYLDVIPSLLKITGGRHIHIGRLTPWALFKIRRGLKRYGIQSDRFIYTPWVPSVWKAPIADNGLDTLASNLINICMDLT